MGTSGRPPISAPGDMPPGRRPPIIGGVSRPKDPPPLDNIELAAGMHSAGRPEGRYPPIFGWGGIYRIPCLMYIQPWAGGIRSV